VASDWLLVPLTGAPRPVQPAVPRHGHPAPPVDNLGTADRGHVPGLTRQVRPASPAASQPSIPTSLRRRPDPRQQSVTSRPVIRTRAMGLPRWSGSARRPCGCITAVSPGCPRP